MCAGVSFDPHREAELLENAEPGAGFVPLFTDRFPDFDWDQARLVARARDEARRRAGERPIGYKLGWTSAAMREALCIAEPNWGRLWSSHRLGGADRPATMRRSSMRHPKIEPEFVYVAGRALGRSVTTDDVVDAAAGWALGLEVVDPRFADFGFRWLDNTADNSSAAGIVTSQVASIPATDPASWILQFGDGEELRKGSGDAVMGSPAQAVAWLADRLAEEGETIEPGMIVFTGGAAAPFDVTVGTTYHATCLELDRSVALDVV